jgi:hypothetical protein
MKQKDPNKYNIQISIVFYSVIAFIVVGPFIYGWGEWVYKNSKFYNCGLTLCLLPAFIFVGFMADALFRVSKVAHSQNHAINIKMMIFHALSYGLLMISSLVLILQTFASPQNEAF